MRKLVTAAVLLAACTPPANVTTTSPSTTTPLAATSTTATPVATTTTTTYPLAKPDAARLRLAVFDFGEDGWDGPNLLPASLWRVHQPSGTIIPLLAANGEPLAGEMESDGWVIDVPLRDRVTWSDGTPITSVDLAFTAGYNHWPAVVEPNSTGISLVFEDAPGWAGFMTDVGLQHLLPAHYWGPLIEQGIEPGVSWEHDLAAPSAGGYRYVGHTDKEITLEAVPSWWDRGSTYESFTDGVRWINPVLGIDETYGSITGEPIAVQENGPHIAEIVYKQTEANRLISDVVTNEADMSLSPIGSGFWTSREGRSNPVVNKAPSVTFLVFGEAAGDLVVREAVTCVVDVEFLRNNVLQGVARPFDVAGAEAESPCNGGDEKRLADAVSILQQDGWTWDRHPTEPLLPTGKTLPGLRDGSGLSPFTSTLATVPGSVDPLRATTALWIENWGRGLGIPIRIMDPDGEPLSGARDSNLIDLPRFGTILQTDPSTFPGLEVARIIASAGTPWSDLATEHVTRIAMAPDEASYEQAVFDFMQALLAENIIIPLYRHSRQDIYNDWVTLPYTEATDGFESIEHVLEAIRIER